MEISPFLLTLMVIWSLIFGAILGAVNDINRITRVFLGVRYTGKRFDKLYEIKLPIINRIKRRDGKVSKGILSVIIFFQDILFFVIMGGGIVVLNYEFNDGIFRWFTVFFVIVGFLVYYFTIGKIVVILSEGIAFVIKAIFMMIFSLILKPVALFGGFLAKKIKKIVLFFNITIANIQKKMYNNYIRNRVLKKSQKAFLNINKKSKGRM